MVPRAVHPSSGLLFTSYSCSELLLMKLEEKGAKESVASYRPQMILRQLRFNWGAVWIVGDVSFSSILESESLFLGYGKDKILTHFTSIFWPT